MWELGVGSDDATAGITILENKDEKPIASMSYVAYTKSGVTDVSERPVTFFYNGGPGSSTIWLHMLAFGPRRVVVGNGTLTPAAPYRIENNDDCLLDATDLVFVDAPGTGFGRVLGKDDGGQGAPKDVFGVDQDANAFADFITQYLTDNNRWTSRKYLFGESYGTIRSAVLSNLLVTDRGVGLNGIVLLSSILNWNITLDFPQINPGVNIAYELGLPSYAATAFYHHKLPAAARESRVVSQGSGAVLDHGLRAGAGSGRSAGRGNEAADCGEAARIHLTARRLSVEGRPQGHGRTVRADAPWRHVHDHRPPRLALQRTNLQPARGNRRERSDGLIDRRPDHRAVQPVRAADAEFRKSYRFYPSGHMVYLDPSVRQHLHDDTVAFINGAYKRSGT